MVAGSAPEKSDGLVASTCRFFIVDQDLSLLLLLLAKTCYSTDMLHSIPTDFRGAIESDSIARRVWADITPLARNEWICWVISAKKKETRDRRISVGLDKMHNGMRRPCCWVGCPHR